MRGLAADCRLAVRTLRATPVVTAAAVLSLALAIGANTAIFSVINALMFRGLAVAAPERLVTVTTQSAITGKVTKGWTNAVWQEMRRHSAAFDGAMAWSLPNMFNLADSGEPQQVEGVYASGEFFQTLGVTPLIGRPFTIADDVRGGGPDGAVAVISYRLWQTRFGGAPSVIGTPIVVDHVPFRIIGVTPPAFFGAEVGQAVDIALPLGTETLIRGNNTLLDREAYWLRIMLRLKAGQPLASATATLRDLQRQIRDGVMTSPTPARAPDFMKEPLTLVASATSSRFRSRYQWPMLAVFGVVTLVLLVACANIANLMLARGAARRYELSMRLALGAPPWRLARQLMVESVLLAAAGAAVGFVLAGWSAAWLVAQLSTSFIPVFLDVSFDWDVLIFSLGVTAGTAVLFGTWPALRSTQVEPLEVLSSRERGGGGIVSSSLIAGQLAVSLVLIVAAGLFVRTFQSLATRPLGFDRERLLVIDADATRASVDAAARPRLVQRAVDAVRSIPGVEGAAASMITPGGGLAMTDLIETTGSAGLSEQERMAFMNYVAPGWFATYGIPITAGRDFDANDTKGAQPVVIVNDAFARRYLRGDAIGATVTYPRAREQRPATAKKVVIGIVGNTIIRSARDEMVPTMYVPLDQLEAVPPSVSISVRTARVTPAALVPTVASALKPVDPNLMFRVMPLADSISASFALERLIAQVAALFGLLALMLSAIGLYGVTAYSVARQRRDIGIRMALGGSAVDIVRLVMSRLFRITAVGITLGGVLSLGTSTLVASLLFGLEPRDPLTFTVAAASLALVATAAALVPVWRATRIDPASVLRTE